MPPTAISYAAAIRGRSPSEIADAARRELCFRYFSHFVRAAWPTVEPTRALLPSTAIDGMVAAAQAVADGRIKRLAVSTCPGTSKSMVWAVLFPAWLLAKQGGQTRIMVGSYSWDFAKRDSQRCRDLVHSDWYKWLVNGEWEVRSDADRKDDWWTTATGRRLITSVEGKSTGERCTIQIVDDALSVASAYSDADKTSTAHWFNEILPSRLEDQRVDQRVIVGQRIAVDDTIAEAVRQGWKYLELPDMLLEGEDPCVLLDDAGVEVWRDRRAVGEPVVELLDAASLEQLKVSLGPAAYSAQYRQKPQGEGAGVFSRDWLTRRWVPDGTTWPVRAGDAPPIELDESTLERQVITLDASFKAGTGSDFAVIQRWGARGGDRFLLEQWRKQAGYVETEAALLEMHKRNPFAKVLIEEAANGHAIIDQLKRQVAGIVAIRPGAAGGAGMGSKQARAMSVQGIVASGAIVLPAHLGWIETWLDEVAGFPNAKHDDVVDAAVYALRELQVADVEPIYGGLSGQ